MEEVTKPNREAGKKNVATAERLENGIVVNLTHAELGNETTKTHMTDQDLRMFSQAIKMSFDGIIIGTIEGFITHVNEAALKMIGATDEKDLIGKHVLAFIAERDRQRATESSLNCLKTGKGMTGEFTALKMSSAEFPVEVTTAIIRNAQGKEIGFIDIVRDITERKKVEEELRENEARFRSLFENSYDAVLLTRPDGGILSANPAACHMFGMSEDEISLTGRSGIVIVDERIFQAIRERERTGRAQGVFTFKRKNGSTFEGETTSNVFVDADGTLKTSMIIRDVTERRKAEEALKRKQDELQTIIDSSQGWIFYKDCENRFVRVNKALAEVMKLPQKELEGRSLFELYPKQQAESFWNDDKQVIASSKPKIGIIETMRSKKGLRWVQTDKIPYIDAKGKIIGVIGFSMDITDLKEAEETLRKSEEKYRLLFANMIDGFAYCELIYDEKGKPVDFVYLEVNDAFSKLAGTKRENLEGKRSAEVMPAIRKNHPELFEVFSRVASTMETEYFEVYIKSMSLWLSFAVYSPKLGCFVAVVENITERKAAERRVAEYSEGLELTVADRTKQLIEVQARLLRTERLAAIGELAGMVGHDLRNPLTATKNAVYFLRKKQGCFVGDSGNKMLTIIEESVEHANKIVSDLLDYSREIHLELEKISIKALVVHALACVQIPNNVRVIERISDCPDVLADKNKLIRLFINLFRNAVDAMPNGGILEVQSLKKGAILEFSVKDTGIGMSEETMAKIFTPLFTTKAQGMGFGLPICKRVVEAHGGRINANSASGEGTTFVVTLPLEPSLENRGGKV